MGSTKCGMLNSECGMEKAEKGISEMSKRGDRERGS